MTKFFLTFLFSFFLVGGVFSVDTMAQFERECPHLSAILPKRGSVEDPHNQAIRERLIKACIEDNKEEFADVVRRSKQIKVLSDSISKSFEENSSLSAEARKELEDLEDLVDSVRKDLKIQKYDDDDEEKEQKQLSTADAVRSLTKAADELTEEIQKISRHTVSVVAIRTTNTVLRLAKFLRIRN